mmetsp:Transcript_35858/g.55928  ORF Transcript_35858/g.55928 Transcript_35858/m.55928 type:complete len:152 (-) Transcript_35858:696-1151(-)|eukprot:CAMPEP_0184315396 /NCGR_PEP_ID=MMETSP1049-20130417/82138_1 /TAXON_ID=77928 /ORGANISM="Proteomonas sulcata, Strain CCMP704" /LENGTH=151 /DNA_ID=CAMNT_0026633859 /DNA_START=113 /DNA_END=568 /DNA_ORIENTATION=-
MVAVTLVVDKEFGYVVVVGLAAWLQQNVFAMLVGAQRLATGIHPPTLYPRDSEIKALQLTEEQVQKYQRTQRIHQNNVEWLTLFYPLLIIAGLHNPLHAAMAGGSIIVARFFYMVGYKISGPMRVLGGWFHFGEWYLAYLCGAFAYKLIES